MNYKQLSKKLLNYAFFSTKANIDDILLYYLEQGATQADLEVMNMFIIDFGTNIIIDAIDSSITKYYETFGEDYEEFSLQNHIDYEFNILKLEMAILLAEKYDIKLKK